MTITEDDREVYDSVASGFHSQHEPDMCLPTAIKNVLDDLEARHEIDGLSMSLSDLNDILGYEYEFATASKGLPEKLDPIIGEVGYTTKISVNIELEDLESIIQDESRSYPIVDLDDAYFDSVKNWNPRAGSDGYQWPHVVIPFAVNHEEVLFYDPMGEIAMKYPGVSSPPSERSYAEFNEWWSAPETRWTLWFQREGQRTLTSPEFREAFNGNI